MTFLILALLVLLAASRFVPALKGQAVTGICLSLCALLLMISVIRCTSSRATPPARMAQDRHTLVGRKLGTALANDIPEGGRIVVLQVYPTHEGLSKLNASQIKGLQKGAGNRFDFQPLDPEDTGSALHVPAKTVAELNKMAEGCAAVVSFLPLPAVSLKANQWPPLYLYDGIGSEYWKKAMQSGLVKAVVHPAAIRGKEKGSSKERFLAIYTLTTPNTNL